MNTKIIKLDINRRLYDKIVAKQDDTKSRFLLFQLLDGAVPFNLTDRSVRVYGVKPDGAVIFNDLTVTHSTTGFCLLELTNQMLAIAGTVKLELMITEGDKKLTSIPFEMEVIKKINSNAAVESSNEFRSLLNALKEIDEWNKEFADKSGKLEELYTPRLNELGSQLETIETEKADIKTELMDTLMCNAIFLKLTNNSNYPILQGGCISEDGLSYYCSLITSGGGEEKGIIQKYAIEDYSDFNTWTYEKCSSEINISHSNDLQYFNGKIYTCNTNTNPTEIILINPNSLDIEEVINIRYGATAITFNKKLNQFITRRKSERGIFDFYDINFTYIKSSEVIGVTYDTVQGIDSDESYIYEPCSEQNFGNSVVVYDLKGNFIKRIGSNVMSEVEHMTNINGYYIFGFYKNGNNFLAHGTLRTDKRLTGGRYKINSGKNTVLTDDTPIWNGAINLNFSKKYYSHLSFKISVDDVETETRILDLTDYAGSHIINTYRLTGTGQVIFYRSILILTKDNYLKIEPFSYYQINIDGSRVVKLYSQEPNAFTNKNSISISNICGQVLCGQRIDE